MESTVDRPRPNTLTIDINGLKADILSSVSAFGFLDHDFYVLYIPSFEITAYGSNVQEAQQMMFQDVLPDFFKALVHLSEDRLMQELEKLGWSKTGGELRSFENTVFVDRDGILQNFGLPADTVIEEQLLSV